MKGNIGIGCISDYDPQPILIQSHLGCFGITTVGKINNADQLIRNLYENNTAYAPFSQKYLQSDSQR